MSSRYIDGAEVTKLIRPVLRARFPACKFSVRLDRYAGGSSIDVSWTDGPTTRLVEEVAGKYHGAEFDGMQDLKTHHDSTLDGERVSFANDYISFHRSLSAGFVARVAEEAEKVTGWPIPRTMDEAARTLITGLSEYASTIIHRMAENRDFYGHITEAPQSGLRLVR